MLQPADQNGRDRPGTADLGLDSKQGQHYFFYELSAQHVANNSYAGSGNRVLWKTLCFFFSPWIERYKFVRSGLHGAADHPFDQRQPQNGDKGFNVTLPAEPAALSGSDNQAFHLTCLFQNA